MKDEPLLSTITRLNFTFVSLYRDCNLEEEIRAELLDKDLIKSKYRGSYFYFIQDPSIIVFDSKDNLLFNNGSPVEPKIPVSLVRLANIVDGKAIFERIKLVLDDQQGAYVETVVENFRISALYYGVSWFILKSPLPERVIPVIKKYCKDIYND